MCLFGSSLFFFSWWAWPKACRFLFTLNKSFKFFVLQFSHLCDGDYYIRVKWIIMQQIFRQMSNTIQHKYYMGIYLFLKTQAIYILWRRGRKYMYTLNIYIYVQRRKCDTILQSWDNYLYVVHIIQHIYIYNYSVWSQTELFWILALSYSSFVTLGKSCELLVIFLELYHLTLFLHVWACLFLVPHYRMWKLHRSSPTPTTSAWTCM